MRHPHAFTLIELLIVVAIIATLAAIAVPNFLEAQTRSKVARTKADMRTVATGIEAYRVDGSAYPIPSDPNAGFIPNPAGAVDVSPFETRVPVLLTTPVSYLSSLPTDVFARTRANGSRVYHAIMQDYVEMRAQIGPRVNWTLVNFRYFRQLLGEDPNPAVRYMLVSWGPDEIHDADVPDIGRPTGPHQHARASLYDPTNGTISSGDIVYFGPSLGFP